MLLRAAAELGLDLAASWMVGDMISDVLAGINAGCRSILVETGKGSPRPRLEVVDTGRATARRVRDSSRAPAETDPGGRHEDRHR